MRTFVDTVNRFAWSVTNGSSDLRVDGLIICCCFFLLLMFCCCVFLGQSVLKHDKRRIQEGS